MIAIISICLASCLYAAAPPETTTPSAEQLLQRGLESYRGARYGDAATDLSAAAKEFLAPERMQSYVNSGRFENLDRLETALVYLSLAQSRLGREDEAREAVLRLMTAERIEATYAKLPLTADAAEFERLAQRLVPGSMLQANPQLAGGTSPPPVPAPAPALAPALAPAVAQATPSAAPVPALSAAEGPSPAPVAVSLTETDRQRLIELVAQECARIQREADARMAAEREAIQKAADERIAAERARFQREAEARIASERAAIEREAEARVAASLAQTRRTYLNSLRQADALAASDQLEQANEIYARIANSPDVPRDILAEAAVGLYRTGAFADAARAFSRLGSFARGEEDLRYYNAVALYETGNFGDAKKELSCALPYIQVTEDVTRYRAKIERTPSRQAMR